MNFSHILFNFRLRYFTTSNSFPILFTYASQTTISQTPVKLEMRYKGQFSKKAAENRRVKRLDNVSKARANKNSTLQCPVLHDYNLSSENALCETVVDNVSVSDHSYSNSSSSSVEFLSETFFSGKLKPIDSTRFVIDLQTFFENMKCKACGVYLSTRDYVGVLPSGITGHLVIRCHGCYKFVRVAMGKVHRPESQHRGPPVFDVNSKLATGNCINKMKEYHIQCTHFSYVVCRYIRMENDFL
jgi:hypothetical protein